MSSDEYFWVELTFAPSSSSSVSLLHLAHHDFY